MKRIISSVLILGLLAPNLHSQSKSVGAGFSWNKAGFQYEQWSKKGSAAFHSYSLYSDFDNTYNLGSKNEDSGIEDKIGIFGRYSYNYVLKEHNFGYSQGRLFIGPGIMAGYVSDKDSQMGLMAGLSLSFGYEMSFTKYLELAVSVNPSWAGHIVKNESGDTKLSIYKNSLYHHLLPEFSIRYNFRNNDRHSLVQQEETGKRAIFGIDLGYDSPVLECVDQYYISSQGYRTSNKASDFKIYNNMHIGVSAGAELNYRNTISALLGLSGLGRDNQIYLNARWMHHFRHNRLDDSVFIINELGPALIIDHIHHHSYLSGRLCCGAGYKFQVDNILSLNLYCALENSFYSPNIYENGKMISPDDVGNSFKYLARLKFGALIQF